MSSALWHVEGFRWSHFYRCSSFPRYWGNMRQPVALGPMLLKLQIVLTLSSSHLPSFFIWWMQVWSFCSVGHRMVPTSCCQDLEGRLITSENHCDYIWAWEYSRLTPPYLDSTGQLVKCDSYTQRFVQKIKLFGEPYFWSCIIDLDRILIVQCLDWGCCPIIYSSDEFTFYCSKTAFLQGSSSQLILRHYKSLNLSLNR